MLTIENIMLVTTILVLFNTGKSYFSTVALESFCNQRAFNYSFLARILNLLEFLYVEVLYIIACRVYWYVDIYD